jgi:hypothetical protein
LKKDKHYYIFHFEHKHTLEVEPIIGWGVDVLDARKYALNTLKGMVAARYGRIGNWVLKSQKTLQGKNIPTEESETA